MGIFGPMSFLGWVSLVPGPFREFGMSMGGYPPHPLGHGTWDTMGYGWQVGGRHTIRTLYCYLLIHPTGIRYIPTFSRSEFSHVGLKCGL